MALGQTATGPGELTLTAPARAFTVVATMPGRRRIVRPVEPSAFTEQNGAMRHSIRIELPIQRRHPVGVPMMEQPIGEMVEPPVMEEPPPGMETLTAMEPPPPVMEPPPPVMEEPAPPDNPF
jgi:hypothetical protein